MNPSEDVDPNDKGLFGNKSILARMFAIAAGPMANYLFASLVVFVMALTSWPSDEPMVVGTVNAGSPAATAGLRAGDIVRTANHATIRNVEDLQRANKARANQPTEYTIERNARVIKVNMTPKQLPNGIVGIGVAAGRAYTTLPVDKAAYFAVTFPYHVTVVQLRELYSRLSQGSTEGITGPIGMGKMLTETVQRSSQEYIELLVLLSIALGMFNLLPFPALDGGRLVFLAYELVSRRKPSQHFEAVVHAVGLVFLLGVLVLVTFRDVLS